MEDDVWVAAAALEGLRPVEWYRYRRPLTARQRAQINRRLRKILAEGHPPDETKRLFAEWCKSEGL